MCGFTADVPCFRIIVIFLIIVKYCVTDVFHLDKHFCTHVYKAG